MPANLSVPHWKTALSICLRKQVKQGLMWKAAVREIKSVTELTTPLMPRNSPKLVGIANWKQGFQACLHQCFTLRSSTEKEKERKKKKLVIDTFMILPHLLSLSHSKRNSFPLGKGRKRVTISCSLAWIDETKTFPIKSTVSVILFSNSPFCNSPSGGRGEGEALSFCSSLQASSSLQPLTLECLLLHECISWSLW